MQLIGYMIYFSSSSGPVGARRKRDLRATDVYADLNDLNGGTCGVVTCCWHQSLIRLHYRSTICPNKQLLISLSDLKTPEVQTVTVSGVSLYVKWATVKGASEYTLIIEREEQHNEEPIVRTIEGDYHNETGLNPGTTYCIRLAAKNAMNQSRYSRPMCRKTGAS